MRTNKTRFGVVAAMVCAAAWNIGAGTRASELGDPAAPLEIGEWIAGGPVDLASAKGKGVVVVEFWATWCPPCRTSIPHLSDLQEKFRDKGVTLVGVSGEEATAVKPFIEKMGDKVKYAIAIDRGGATSDAYMKAYGQSGIPHAFVVDREGRVAWHGHPMSGLDEALEQIIAGTFDIETGKKRGKAEALLRDYLELCNKDEPGEKADAVAKELVKLDEEIGGIQPGRKFDPEPIKRRVQFVRRLQDFQQALFTANDPKKLAAIEERLLAVAPEDFDIGDAKKDFLAEKAFSDYMREATGDADKAKLAELGKVLEAIEPSGPEILNEIAWMLLTEERMKTRDLALATRIAKAACEGSGEKDPAILDTYARALFDSGKAEEAIRYEEKALTLATDDETRGEIEESLKKYRESVK